MRVGFLWEDLRRGGGFLGQGPPAALGLLGRESGGHSSSNDGCTRNDDHREKVIQESVKP